ALAWLGRQDTRWYRPLDPSTLLRLLPRMGEYADGTAKHEQAPGWLWGDAKLGVDDRGHPVDVYRHPARAAFVEHALDGQTRLEVPTRDVAIRPGFLEQLQNGITPGVDRVEPVTEPRQVLRSLAPVRDDPTGHLQQLVTIILPHDDLVE